MFLFLCFDSVTPEIIERETKKFEEEKRANLNRIEAKKAAAAATTTTTTTNNSNNNNNNNNNNNTAASGAK